jgi:hypothetical protein
LDWLNNEKKKDSAEIEKQKRDFANQMRAIKKEDLFKQRKKTLWMRIKNLIWGI